MIKKFLPSFLKAAIKKEVIRIATEVNKNNLEIFSNSNLLEQKIRQISAEEIKQTLATSVNSRLLSAPSIPAWYAPNIGEPSVNLALRDLCKPGQVVFDVGCHQGELTLLMSRLVGPRGIVCAFEANPYILDLCTHNLVRNGCNNFFITHAAVWQKSDETIDLNIPPDNMQAASINYPTTKYEPTPVETIALDDFIHSTRLEPDLIKMDIEGAEFDALNGTYQYISQKRPFLILEQFTTETRCLEFLKNQGYIALDLSNYRFINSINDYPPGSEIRNVLFCHESKINLTPYTLDISPKFLQFWEQDKFKQDDNIIATKEPIRLDKGRYLVLIDFESLKNNASIFLCIYVENQPIANYIGDAKQIENSYKDLIINLDAPSEVKVEIKPWSSQALPTKLSINFNGLKIYQIW